MGRARARAGHRRVRRPEAPRRRAAAPFRLESLPVSVLVLAYLAFTSIALPDGLAGVAWPSVSGSIGVPVSYLGLLLPFAVASSTLSSITAGFVLDRLGLGRVLAGSTAVSVLALLGYAAATSMWVVLAATIVLAAGSGAIDAGLNAVAARTFTARRITWMHASYGAGAMLGPLLISASLAGGLSWRWAYVFIAVLQAVIAVAFALTAGAWARLGGPAAEERGAGAPARPLTSVLRHRGVRLGVALFFLQNGVEGSTALWAYLFLTGARGLRPEIASLVVSAYWIVQSAGRLVLGPIAERRGPYGVLAGGALGFVLGAVLLTVPGTPLTAAVGVVLIGVSAAPMSPLLMLTTKDRTGPELADRAVGLQAGASTVGSTAFPALIGALIGHYGAGVFAVCMVVITATAGAVQVASLSRRSSPATPEAEAA